LWTWYQIETAWDFAFVQVSTDGGSTWTSLSNPHTTDVYDPGAIGYVIDNVPGFTGSSEVWVEETFDLSAYDGMSVLLRFVYATDWAYTEAGFYVDDVVVSDDGGVVLSDDLEAGSGNWLLDGFEYTTGLAENDWGLTFINPVYVRGRFSEYEIYYDSMYPDGDYQRDLTSFGTLGLNRDEVTIILSNHQPEGTSFAANYLLLVEKGNAK
jgi:hypothetical protein